MLYATTFVFSEPHVQLINYLFPLYSIFHPPYPLFPRSRHTTTNFIPATFLPSFLDLVVWGHEHRSHTSPEYQGLTDINAMAGGPEDPDEDDHDDRMGFYIYQPGSSVATSLCEGEATKK